MAEAARQDQNPSSAPPALPQSVVWRGAVEASGGKRGQIQRWIRLERDGPTVLETPRDKISYLGKG
jgi:hypothetical protein